MRRSVCEAVKQIHVEVSIWHPWARCSSLLVSLNIPSASSSGPCMGRHVCVKGNWLAGVPLVWMEWGPAEGLTVFSPCLWLQQHETGALRDNIRSFSIQNGLTKRINLVEKEPCVLWRVPSTVSNVRSPLVRAAVGHLALSSQGWSVDVLSVDEPQSRTWPFSTACPRRHF